jgi:hypothetical protein
MSGQSSGQPAWSPTPSSSSSSIKPSVSNREHHNLDGNYISTTSGRQNLDSAPPIDLVNDLLPENYDARVELGGRRHRTRHSSGFLLQTKHTPDKQHFSSPSEKAGPTQDLKGKRRAENADMKGKRRAENADMIIRKRRSDPRQNYTRLAVGGSPLTTEILNSTPPVTTDEFDRISREGTLSVPSRPSRALNTNEGDGIISNIWSTTKGNESRQSTSSALGHDTDPAQIVNLALNLSESRRRNSSASATLPTNLGNRRLPSLGQHNKSSSDGVPRSAGGSLRQYLQHQRYASRNISPRSSRVNYRDSSSTHSPRKIENPSHSTVSGKFDSLSHGTIFNPSDATLTRAEKARTTLELYYEYRRLLQNLPAIPIPSGNESALARSSGKLMAENTQGFQGLGRSYNPLQYIRNRRVRARERRMFNAEEDGWKNLDKVRSWVDMVLAEREASKAAEHVHYPLPKFDIARGSLPATDSAVEPNSSTSGERQNNQLRRPRLDWSFAPWDLLADAYWMHQDDNIKQIEDANGDKIIPELLSAKGTPPWTSRDIIPSPTRRSQSKTRQGLTPEKLQSLFGHSRHNSTERGRTPHPLSECKTPVSKGASSRDRKSRWARNPIRSRDSSSSNDSLILGGRGYRDSGYFITRDHPESAALEKQMREMVKKEAHDITLHQLAKDKEHKTVKDVESGLDTRPPPPAGGTITPSEDHTTGDQQELKDVLPNSKVIGRSASTRIDRQEFRQYRLSFDEPNAPPNHTPYVDSQVPGSGIDSSPAISRPTSSKNASNSVVTSDQRVRSKGPHVMGEKDKKLRLLGKNMSRPEDSGVKVHITKHMDSLIDPGSEHLQITIVESPIQKLGSLEDMSRKPHRVSNDHESGFRGFFKGRRIAQLVGNEVHRVGDKLRKKENLNDLSRVSSIQSGYATDESDLGTDLSALESSPDDPLSPARKRIREGNQRPNESRVGAHPTYHHKRLPSFRSASVKPEQPPIIPKTLGEDHITRQQLAQRARGRSSRFNRLAPPKIDVNRISSPVSPPTIHSHPKETDLSRDGSRQSSDSRSDNPVHDANRRLKDVLENPGMIGSGRQLESSTSSLEIRNSRASSQPNIQGQRQWCISDRSVSALRGAVTKRDIARTEALLLSSGVKANEISRRGQAIDDLPPVALRNLPQSLQAQSLRVPRSQEHMFAARILIENIGFAHQRLRDAAEEFSNTGVNKLHNQLRVLDERLTCQLTPTVRGFADEADALSAELATTHTLKFKQVNDSIEILLRRRRRRFRWIRRGGYVLLEWTLLGIMWWAWLIVVMVRLARCTIGAFTGSLRWIFWM